MWSLWKEVLLPGRQQTAQGEWFTISARDVRQAKANAERMLSRGVPIPTVWEHQDVEAGDPEEWKARYARHTFGSIAGARLNGRGGLEFKHVGPDVRDRDQLIKTRFVSPKLYRAEYSDSRGGTYRGATVAHVAATPTPVQFWQKPFQLSSGRALYLSYTPEGSTVADDNDSKADEGGGGDPGGATGIGAVIEALRDIGMNIPDEVNDEAGLVIAIKAGGKPGGGGDGMDDLDAPPADAATTPAGGPPMVMSATDRNPAVAQQARNWARMERPELHARIKELFASGRVDRPTAAKLRRQAEAVQMSFTRDGDAVSPLHRRLAELEKLPAHAAWKPDGRGGLDMSAARAADVPAKLAGTDGDPAKVIDWMCAGLPAKK